MNGVYSADKGCQVYTKFADGTAVLWRRVWRCYFRSVLWRHWARNPLAPRLPEWLAAALRASLVATRIKLTIRLAGQCLLPGRAPPIAVRFLSAGLPLPGLESSELVFGNSRSKPQPSAIAAILFLFLPSPPTIFSNAHRP